MMSCIQITSFQPCCNFTSVNHLRSDPSASCVSLPKHFQPLKALINLTACSSSYLGLKIRTIRQKLTIGASGFQQSTPVCLFGGKGKSESDDERNLQSGRGCRVRSGCCMMVLVDCAYLKTAEGSPWKGLEKAMGNLKKEPSIEEMLRQQIQKQEYYDDGGNGGKNTGGSGGGDVSGSGESDDESLSGILDETVQVFLATIGFVFLYMYIIEGEEITTFAKDIIKFLFTRRKSIRLTRFIDNWARFFREISPTEDSDPNWLEREIINTPTWFDSPTKYERILRRHMSSRSY